MEVTKKCEFVELSMNEMNEIDGGAVPVWVIPAVKLVGKGILIGIGREIGERAVEKIFN